MANAVQRAGHGRFSAEAWALLERAMVGARDASGGGMSDGEALEALARDALGGAVPARIRPRRSVVGSR
ncbi:MAG: hypothetical protein KF718_12695 [Polyangiaceae bacterium]|nr:hypothetical protein [Polyangiaceae bacterium]